MAFRRQRCLRDYGVLQFRPRWCGVCIFRLLLCFAGAVSVGCSGVAASPQYMMARGEMEASVHGGSRGNCHTVTQGACCVCDSESIVGGRPKVRPGRSAGDGVGKHADAGPGRFSCVRGVPCRRVVFYVDLRLAESGRGASGLRLRLFAGRLPLQPPGDDASEYVIPATGCLSGILRPCIVR